MLFLAICPGGGESAINAHLQNITGLCARKPEIFTLSHLRSPLEQNEDTFSRNNYHRQVAKG
jgi:hypothetical protein